MSAPLLRPPDGAHEHWAATRNLLIIDNSLLFGFLNQLAYFPEDTLGFDTEHNAGSWPDIDFAGFSLHSAHLKASVYVPINHPGFAHNVPFTSNCQDALRWLLANRTTCVHYGRSELEFARTFNAEIEYPIDTGAAANALQYTDTGLKPLAVELGIAPFHATASYKQITMSPENFLVPPTSPPKDDELIPFQLMNPLQQAVINYATGDATLAYCLAAELTKHTEDNMGATGEWYIRTLSEAGTFLNARTLDGAPLDLDGLRAVAATLKEELEADDAALRNKIRSAMGWPTPLI